MPVCRYCQTDAALLRHGDAGYPYARDYGPTWTCRPCRAWVGCHPGTTDALGRLANAELRAAKQAAHAAFDPMWQRKAERDGVARGNARRAGYRWLADQMGLSFKDTHIGHFDLAQCLRVVEVCTNPSTRSEPMNIPATEASKEPYIAIPMVQVKSNQIACIGYDATRRTLSVQFTRGTGAEYHYPNVAPETHDAFMAAESKGKFFGEHIKALHFEKHVPPAKDLDLSSEAPLERCEPAGTGDVCESCQ